MTTRRWQGRIVAAGPGRRVLLGLSAAALVVLSPASRTQDAVANGDTRTIDIVHEHTKESASVTFRRNGQYDGAALKQLNWLLRDWRLDAPTEMDPRLFDIVWQVRREVGAREPVHVLSAYRSPETNAALRRRSRAVAEHSQHMLGKAMDFYLPDVSMARVREIGMRLQSGGVGFYPNSLNTFVHLDAGSVRSWPRMPRPQLARLFPDGRTVHIPKDGKPMSGYEEAKSTILARGGSVAGYASYAEAGEESGGPRNSLWAMLFGGGGGDEDQDFYGSGAGRAAAGAVPASAAAGGDDDAGTRTAAASGRSGSTPSRTQLAAAGEPPGGLDAPSARSPLPPRRPNDIVALPKPSTAAAAANLPAPPPFFPGARGERASSPPALRPPAGGDEKAALRSLFEAAATPTAPPGRAGEVPVSRGRVQPVTAGASLLHEPGPKVRTSFSSATLDDPPADAFRGPAVARLPASR